MAWKKGQERIIELAELIQLRRDAAKKTGWVLAENPQMDIAARSRLWGFAEKCYRDAERLEGLVERLKRGEPEFPWLTPRTEVENAQ